MPINLTKPAEQVKLDAPEYGAMLNNLQANILGPHGRDHVRHLFIRFTGNRAAVRAWIRGKIASNVTTASQQRKQSQDRAIAKAAGQRFDGELVTGFFLSASG